MNFPNALEKIHGLIEKYEADTEKIAKDIPVLQEVVKALGRITQRPQNGTCRP